VTENLNAISAELAGRVRSWREAVWSAHEEIDALRERLADALEDLGDEWSACVEAAETLVARAEACGAGVEAARTEAAEALADLAAEPGSEAWTSAAEGLAEAVEGTEGLKSRAEALEQEFRSSSAHLEALLDGTPPELTHLRETLVQQMGAAREFLQETLQPELSASADMPEQMVAIVSQGLKRQQSRLALGYEDMVVRLTRLTDDLRKQAVPELDTRGAAMAAAAEEKLGERYTALGEALPMMAAARQAMAGLEQAAREAGQAIGPAQEAVVELMRAVQGHLGATVHALGAAYRFLDERGHVPY
jgi:hypothetical protein